MQRVLGDERRGADGRLFVAGGQAIFDAAVGRLVGRPGDGGVHVGADDVDIGDDRRRQVGRLGGEAVDVGRGHAVAAQVAAIDRDRDERVGRKRLGGHIGDGQVVGRAAEHRLHLLAVDAHDDAVSVDAAGRINHARGDRGEDVHVGGRRGRVAPGNGRLVHVEHRIIVASEDDHRPRLLDEVADAAAGVGVGKIVVTRHQHRFAQGADAKQPLVVLSVLNADGVHGIEGEARPLPVHAQEVSLGHGAQVEVGRQHEVVGDGGRLRARHMDAGVHKVGDGVVDDGIVTDELVRRRDTAGSFARVAGGVQDANLEAHAGLVDDVLDVPDLGDDAIVGRLDFDRADVVGRAVQEVGDRFLATRPAVVAVGALPIAVLTVVVHVVAVVVGVELDKGRARPHLCLQGHFIVVDHQRAAVVGRKFSGVVLDRQQRAVYPHHVAADQRVGVVIVDADADVVDVIEAMLTPEGDGVLALGKRGEGDLADPRRAAPLVADGGGVDGWVAVDAEAGAVGVVVAPQVEIDLRLEGVGGVIGQGDFHRLGALVLPARLNIPRAAGVLRQAVNATAGELGVRHPVLFVGYFGIGIKHTRFRAGGMSQTDQQGHEQQKCHRYNTLHLFLFCVCLDVASDTFGC